MKFNNLFITILSSFVSLTYAIELQVGNQTSVCNAATEIIDGIMDYYLGTRYGGTVGMFQEPYYWWEAGLVFGGMIDTWKFCNNDTYVDVITASIKHQKGDNNDFITANQSHVEANDDQVFWGFTVLEAAERNFPNYSTDDTDPSYVQLALNVYNSMADRWDVENCGGGLRWQIYNNMSGWDYKSTISTAGVYALAGRLGRYTNDDQFIKSASRILRWFKQSLFIQNSDNSDYYNVYDGSEIVNNSCPVVNGAIWSYNYALMTMGTVYLYNTTGDDSWKNELDKFLGGIEHYFLNSTSQDILFEYQCDQWNRCNNDQRAFRAIVARVLGEVVQLAPDFADRALKIIDASAKGAAESCSGGSDGRTCGMNWAYGGWDGWYGLGEQIAALEIIQNSIIDTVPLPCTEKTCGEDINDDENEITTIPPPTVTRYFTETHTNVETDTVIISTIDKVFYTGI